MTQVLSGLDVLSTDADLQGKFKGKVALLAHNASIDANCRHATLLFRQIFGDRFIKLFGPQHGFSTDVQDNMIETDHTIHPFFQIPVFSLYSETRIPTDGMLADIDHFFVDLQDIGCRMYTYIYTLSHLLDKCATHDIEVIILDRPNPINGQDIEGNILSEDFSSFIGLHPLPVRHGLTMGEFALMHQRYWAGQKARLQVIRMKGWQRYMNFDDTGLPWALPSPNIPRPMTCLTFPGTVLFEGTTLSEGRGTTQSLEIVGHPHIEPYGNFVDHLERAFVKSSLKGCQLRPINFMPTFQKHAQKACGGFQLHVTDAKTFSPWKTGQLLMRELYRLMGDRFKWKQPPYEYDFSNLPIDIINGTNALRQWVENQGSIEELQAMESHREYRAYRNPVLIY